MKNSVEDQSTEGSSARFHIVQPLRDLELNWAVDLAKNLEEYLLKICSGEITGEDDGQFPVNFAEAALLLQGSIQVYSRKVEYLYSLVLHALEFISQKRQQDQPENNSVQPDGVDSHLFPDEENELFLGLDDVQVEAKNCLNDGLSDENNDALHHFGKPPANLVVLEGDCLDATVDAGGLESYLLATCDLYQDFLLLDPCDAVAVNNFLKGDQAGTHQNVAHRGSSLKSKSRKTFQSPTRQSGGTACKSSLAQSQNANINQSPEMNGNAEVNFDNVWLEPPTCNLDSNDYHGNEMDGGYSEHMDDQDGGGGGDDDDDDDPWKPLNPHESGNLKIKPFNKVKALRRQDIRSTKQSSLATQFPLARLHGTIDPEFSEIWEAQVHALERLQGSQSPPLYEKLRQSLVFGGLGTANAFGPHKDEDEDDDHDRADFEEADVNMPETTYMETEIPEIPEIPLHEEGDDAACFDGNETFGVKDSNSLEDLCRAHLDALLASIAETEQQSELTARVSSWKQRIEQNLEEQDSHTPFDIHEYGGRVLEKLSLEADGVGGMSFTDIVEGQEKHDVARTFSALLQLVNNGDVDLDKGSTGGEHVCYTAVNPFYVRVLNHDKRRDKEKLNSLKKRVRSPLREVHVNGDGEKAGEQHPKFSSSTSGVIPSVKSSRSNKKFSVKLEKVNRVRCSPEGKRRRRFQLIETVDLKSAG
ncbi:condensin-2 complex subunit H2-like isoform X2 [Telopea speciosissima]|uniref:condensin-2 complex subunit H2-like isoform X2 n=1 Tax=Telopea speciosissima TaxID=54955 RepID=UPI001CC6A65D|nr:condensin-2 complex subunit H2-like isoform X2 [Telopea speciosissima]